MFGLISIMKLKKNLVLMVGALVYLVLQVRLVKWRVD